VTAATEDKGTPRAARWFVGVALALLMIPGVIGFDAWPLTGWRLFSLSRTDHQNRWVLDAVDAEGSLARVSLEELPLRYRQAEWPMAELPGAGDASQQALCRVLLDAVVAEHPATVALHIVKEQQRLEREGDDYAVTSEPTVVVRCDREP
jgi:hypothetical protein